MKSCTVGRGTVSYLVLMNSLVNIDVHGEGVAVVSPLRLKPFGRDSGFDHAFIQHLLRKGDARSLIQWGR